MEERLARLGIWRFPIPTPFADVRVVNVYAIEDEGGGLALLDTGTDDPPAHAAREAALARIGYRPSDVRRIIVSHGHPDHYGAAQTLADRHEPPLPIHAFPDDFDRSQPTGSRWADSDPQWQALFARHGVPAPLIAGFPRVNIHTETGHARPLRDPRPLREGSVLRFERFEASVLHLPGHTLGVVCLFDAANGVLFSNDHLLQGVTPFLRVEPGPGGEERLRPLLAYAASLERTRALEARLVLPGHGRPFEDARGEIDALFRKFAERQRRIVEALAERPLTAYALLEALAPRTAPVMVKDVLSMTIAHLQALEARGEVTREETNGVFRFAVAGR